jgi:hypothetical protein
MSRPERVNDALEFKKLKNTQTAELKAVVASKANQSSEVIVKYVKEKLNAMRIPFLGVMPGEISGNTVINVHLKHQTYSFVVPKAKAEVANEVVNETETNA